MGLSRVANDSFAGLEYKNKSIEYFNVFNGPRAFVAGRKMCTLRTHNIALNRLTSTSQDGRAV